MAFLFRERLGFFFSRLLSAAVGARGLYLVLSESLPEVEATERSSTGTVPD